MIVIAPPLISAARKVGVSLSARATSSLARTARLLPGPRTDILMIDGTQVIPSIGITGVTEFTTGQVQITIDAHQSPRLLKRTLDTWLLVALAHEVDHSVRVQAGPGEGGTLLDRLITEGMSSAFDIQVSPTIRLPWVHALTPG